MIFTNKTGLPESFVRAVTRDARRPSDNFSPSAMTNSPRQYWLYRRHFDEITEDVADRVWALMGQGLHGVLEGGEGSGELVEQYLTAELDGKTISGRADLYDGELVADWKTTSAWSVLFKDDKMPEWSFQLNTYAWLYRQAGFPVERLEIVALLRDWSKRKATESADYPQAAVVKIPVPMMADEVIEAKIRERVEILSAHKDTPDDKLPFCSKRERWEDADKYAVKKWGNKRAVRVLEDRGQADEMARSLQEKTGDRHHVEERPAAPRRCFEYCSVAPFCNQFKLIKGE